MIETKQQARFIIRSRQSFQQFQFLLHRLLLLLQIPPLTSRSNIIPQITVIAEPRRIHSPTTDEPQSSSFITNRTTVNRQATGAPTGICVVDFDGLRKIAAEEAGELPGNGAEDLHGFGEKSIRNY